MEVPSERTPRNDHPGANWLITNRGVTNRAHLDETWARLQRLRENAPPGYRESMMQMQPMHRAIAEDVERMAEIERGGGERCDEIPRAQSRDA